MNITIVALSLAIVATSAPATAQVIDACVKNDGSLHIVEGSADCRKNETPISWNAAGPAGPQGPAGDRGPAGDNLVVIDGSGNVVGQLVSMSYRGGDPYLVIYLDSVQAVVGVGLLRGSLQEVFGPILIFGDPACRGPAFVDEQHAGYLLPVVRTDETARRFFVGRPGPLTRVAIGSISGTNGVCRSTSGANEFLVAEEVTDLLDVTFPLEVPLTVDRVEIEL